MENEVGNKMGNKMRSGMRKGMRKNAGCKCGRDKYRFIVLFLALLAAWCFRGCGQSNEIKLSAVVRIDLGASMASGVVYGRTQEELVIVTAGHVLKGHSAEEGGSATESPASVEVIWGELAVTASEWYVSENSEVAFISIPLAVLPEEILENVQVVPRDQARFDQLKENAAVLMKGYSADGEFVEISGKLVYSWIYAEDFAQYMMLIDGESFPGMSGGGVFDEMGNLAGLICGVNDVGESAAVPLSIIVAEYMQVYPNAG